MEKEFIPYAEALDMSKLGFEGGRFAVYFPDGRRIREHGLYTYPKQIFKDVIRAPLWQEAFEWFRERKDIDSWIQKHTGGENGRYTANWVIHHPALPLSSDPTCRLHTFHRSSKTEDLLLVTVYYSTYEEAQLACLQQLIKIVQK